MDSYQADCDDCIKATSSGQHLFRFILVGTALVGIGVTAMAGWHLSVALVPSRGALAMEEWLIMGALLLGMTALSWLLWSETRSQPDRSRSNWWGLRRPAMPCRNHARGQRTSRG